MKEDLRLLRQDSGFSLVELMVYSVILIVAMGIASVVFIRVIESQIDIKSMAESNNEAQLLFKELEYDLRNAAWVETDFGGNLITMQTRSAVPGDDGRHICSAYFYDPTEETLYRSRTTTNGAVVAARSASSEAELLNLARDWPGVYADVAPLAGSPVFLVRTSVDVGVQSALQVNTDDPQKLIKFDKLVVLRPQAGISPGCE